MAKTRDEILQVGRPRDTCLLCDNPLNVDGKHPTLIQVSETEEVIRKDFCAECWGRLSEEGYFSFWITNRVNKPTAKERRLAKSERNEALWRLFAALHSAHGGEEDFAPQLFLLAHLLMRYKVLMFAGAGDGKLNFLHPKFGESFEIDDLPYETIDFTEINQQIEAKAADYAPEAEPTRDDGKDS